jgi:hypothetical protein
MKETETLSLLVVSHLGEHALKYRKMALNLDEVVAGTVHNLVTKWLQDPGNALLIRQTVENQDLPPEENPYLVELCIAMQAIALVVARCHIKWVPKPENVDAN